MRGGAGGGVWQWGAVVFRAPRKGGPGGGRHQHHRHEMVRLRFWAHAAHTYVMSCWLLACRLTCLCPFPASPPSLPSLQGPALPGGAA